MMYSDDQMHMIKGDKTWNKLQLNSCTAQLGHIILLKISVCFVKL